MSDLLDILIASPGMPFQGDSLVTGSIGGSEAAAINIARALAKRGHSVTCFSPTDKPGPYDGVIYRPIQEYLPYAAGTPHDIAVVSRSTELARFHVQAKAVILWCHDLALKRQRGLFGAALWNLASVYVLSEFQRRQYLEIHELIDPVLHVTRNGLDLHGIQSATRNVKRERNLLVYGSRPERGLETALNVMEMLAKRGSPLRLQVSYYDNPIPDLQPYYEALFQRARGLPNVTIIGALKQPDWWRAVASAGALLYPGCSGDFSEIHCLVAHEAQALGTPVVALAKGALPEALGAVKNGDEWKCETGILLGHQEQNTLDDTYLGQVATALQDLTGDLLRWERLSKAGKERGQLMAWSRVAEEWEQHWLTDLLPVSQDEEAVKRHLKRIGDHEAANGNGESEAAA